jgi:hypothetical protein
MSSEENQMKRFLFGLAALPFLAGVALAAQPVPLSDAQMDRVTAGFDIYEQEIQNTGRVVVEVNQPAPADSCTNCYINVINTYYNDPTTIAMQTYAKFGPEPFNPPYPGP